MIENVSMSDSLIVNAETGTFQLQNSDSKSSLDQELIKEKIVSVLFAQDVNLSSDVKNLVKNLVLKINMDLNFRQTSRKTSRAYWKL